MDKIKGIEKGIKKTVKSKKRKRDAIKGIEKIQSRLKSAQKRFHKLERRGTRFNLRNKISYGGRTLPEWERDWEEMGYLKFLTMSQIGDTSGLFRLTLNGKVVYIGSSFERLKGGLRQSLSSFRRSSRKGNLEKISKEDFNKCKVEILDLGNSTESESLVTILENRFKEKYNPIWN
ncbi:MAG: hypothetical protein GX219_03620 [Tissierellia bacterium]|nr:hypothetical protein [Tissierellia bacterium]